MQALAHYRYAPISAQKARLVADQVRGLSVEKAILLLRFSEKKAASLVKKVVDSAVANAEHNLGADVDELFVFCIFVNEGPRVKRFRSRARGRSNRILKRYCHITVMISDKKDRSR